MPGRKKKVMSMDALQAALKVEIQSGYGLLSKGEYEEGRNRLHSALALGKKIERLKDAEASSSS